tara:strand:+ start:8027 stop:8440 length:414 start_codon:yes stop_codon:yes gene_type:complete
MSIETKEYSENKKAEAEAKKATEAKTKTATEAEAKKATEAEAKIMGITDQKAAKDNVKDINFFGADLFKLMSKASSEKEGWMNSTKGMWVKGAGVMVNTTSIHNGRRSEALAFFPNVILKETKDGKGNVTGRYLSNK